MPTATTRPDPASASVRRTYSLYEYADVIGISYRHAADLATEGNLPGAFRLGRRWLVSRDVVDQMLAAPATTAVPNEGGAVTL